MKVVTDTETVELGTTETTPTIGITDYSVRTTDDFGVTTVTPRGFSRTLSAKMLVATDQADALQRRLAALRATSARWVADDRFAWLGVQGFYKDFSIELALQTVSYCTLTVEGLAETETAADPGGDPAPTGATSTLMLLQPIPMTDAVLVASNVNEGDALAWNAATSYAADARVMRTSVHRVYESLTGGNVGATPETSPAAWLDLGPTNRWAMFDQALGTASTATGSIVLTFAAGSMPALALLDVTAATIRVQVQSTSYDETQAAGPGAVTFFDLPTGGGQVTVTISGSGEVSVGTLLVGALVALGITEASPTAGITDYSRKDVDAFGATTVVQRAWSKNMAAKALIRTDAVDMVAGRIAAVRAVPSLWLGQVGLDSLTVYGFFKDFSIEVSETTAMLSLTIEGLSTASQIDPLTIDFENVVGDTKPDPNATNSADPNSPFGNTTVRAFTSQSAYTAQVAAQVQQDMARLQAETAQDTTPPGVPTGLAVASALQPNGTVTLTLSWNGVGDADLSQYDLQVSLNGGGYVSTLTKGTSYTFAGLQPNTSVLSRVRAIDTSDNRSGYSASVSGTTVRDTTPPAAPTALAATASFGGVFLSWTNAADADLSAVQIYEGATNSFAASSPLPTVGALPGKPGGYSRSGLPTGATRSYWLASIDTSGNASAQAGPVSATTASVANADLSPGLAIPQTVNALPTSTGGGRIVYLSTDGKLYRDTAAGWSKSTDGADITAYTITTAQLKAGLITASKLAVTGDGLNNDPLLQDYTLWHNVGSNGGEQGPLAAGYAANGWYVDNQAANAGNLGTPFGVSLYASNPAWTDPSQRQYLDSTSAQAVIINGGKSYELSATLYNASSQWLYVTFGMVDASGNVVVAASGSQTVSLAPNGGKAVLSTAFVAPANAVAGYFAIYNQGTGSGFGGAAFTGYMRASTIQVREQLAGTMVIDGTLTARNIAVGSLTGDRMTAGTFTGDLFQTGTSLPGTITVGATGVSIATMQAQAANPAAVVNAGTTLITPGRILLAGATTLTNWMAGGDNTQINGGAIYANTITANSLKIGARGINVSGIDFQVVNGGSAISWTSGSILYTADDGSQVATTIAAATQTTTNQYVYWHKGDSALNTTNDYGTAQSGDNLIMASWTPGSMAVRVAYGGTILDGSRLTIGSVDAIYLKANSITSLYLQAGIITGRELAVQSITADKITVNTIVAGNMAFGSGGVKSLNYADVNQDIGDNSTYHSIGQVEVMPLNGQPIDGRVSFCATALAAASTRISVIVARDDGTVIKGAPGGGEIYVAVPNGGTMISFDFIDSVAAGRDTTYYVKIINIDGTNNGVRYAALQVTAEEQARQSYQHTTIIAASGGWGSPGSGSGGSASTGGGNINGGGGGLNNCPHVDELVLLANEAGDGPGDPIRAGDLRYGQRVWTQPDGGGEWGAFPITYVGKFDDDLWEAPGRPITSPSHLWDIDGAWVRMDAIGEPLGRRGQVVALHVDTARTYVLVASDGTWMRSHNKTTNYN